MKTIYLVRHAHAEAKNARTDFFRILDEEGRKEAVKTGQMLLEKNIMPEQIFASSSKRTMETATIIANEIKYPSKNIKAEEALYLANEHQYLELIQKINNNINKIMISGHNPAISGFAYALSGTFSNNMPTSSCVVLTINTTTWESINWRTAKVIDYIEVPIS